MWRTLPPRLISRYYTLAIRALWREQDFLARLQGVDLPEPEWLYDKPQAFELPPPPVPVPSGTARRIVPDVGEVFIPPKAV